MDQSKALAGVVITSMSFALGFALTRTVRQAALTSAIALAASSAGVVVADGRSRQRSIPHSGIKPNPLQSLPSAVTVPGLDEPNIAIFWDYENVRIPTQGTSAPLAELLVDYAKSLGHPRLKIVYANWTGRQNGRTLRRDRGNGPAPINKEEVVVKALYSLGFEPIYVSMGKANSSDVKLAVDCISAVYREPSLQHIIIVTGDKDFIPLVNALKDLGKRVTIIGHADKVSEHLMLSADEFVSVKELLATDSVEPVTAPAAESSTTTTPMRYEDAVQCLLEAIEAALEQGKSTRIETIGRLMRTINAQYLGATEVYTPNQQGTFTKFSAFIAMVANEGKIRVETTDSGFKELFLLEEDPADETEFRTGAIAALGRDQWQTLIHEVQAILEEKGSLSFVPLLCMLSKAKQNGSLAFLSHSSLRKALQQLIEVNLLVKEDEKLFGLQNELADNLDQFLNQLQQINDD